MQRTASSSSWASSSSLAVSIVSIFVEILSRSSPCPRVRRRVPNVSSAMIVSSGGSEERDPVEVDLGGEPALKCLEFRSVRPDRLEFVDEICD